MSCCTSTTARRAVVRRSRARSARSWCSIPTNVAVELPELALLGVDPIADGLTLPQLRQLVRSRNRRLKQLLLDQHLIAGIGNIYADEILHAARLRPDRIVELARAAVGGAAARRDPRRARRRRSCRVARRSRDTQYVDLFGDGGSYQDDHRVYGRAGERCLTCGRRHGPADRRRPALDPLLPDLPALTVRHAGADAEGSIGSATSGPRVSERAN